MDAKYYIYLVMHEGVVVYVGKGCGDRDRTKCGRVSELVAIWDQCTIVRFREDLTEREAFTLEAELIEEHRPTGKLLNRVSGLCPQKRVDVRDRPALENNRIAVKNARGERTPTPTTAAGAMYLRVENLAKTLNRPPNILIQGDRNVEMYKPVSHIPANITLVDDDPQNLAVLTAEVLATAPARACAGLRHVIEPMDFLAMKPPLQKYDIILMNPPFNTKVGGKITKRNLWKKFADKALLMADEVVTLAPLSAKTHGKLVLGEFGFEEQENPACVVVWNRESPNLPRPEEYPTFDATVQDCSNGNLDSKGPTVSLRNFMKPETYRTVNLKTAIRYGYGKNEEAAYVGFGLDNHRIVYSREPLFGRYRIHGPDFKKMAEWLNSAEGVKLLKLISNNTNAGTLNVLTSDNNHPSFNINRIIGRVK